MWQPISTAPEIDLEEVLLVLDDGTVSPGYFAAGTDDDGEQVEQPGWWWFDSTATGPAQPILWQPYPVYAEGEA